jgi:ABC-2 type transport system permease protein
MIAVIDKYASVARISFLNVIAYFWEFSFGTIFMVILLFVLANFWKTIYATKEGIPGFTLVQMIWYLVLAEAIMFSSKKIGEDISVEIKSGNIAYQLNKPYSYALFKYFDYMAIAAFRFVVTFTAGAIAAYLLVGPFDFDFRYAPFVLLSVFFAVTVNFTFNFLIGLLAFWFEDIAGFEWVYGKFVLIIGGTLLPFEIFPEWIAKIVSYLPFSTIGYYPAKLFAAPHLQDVSSIYLFQLAWIVIMIAVVWTVYHFGVKKVNINGG